MADSRRSASSQSRPAQMAREDDIAHVACCRDPAWLGGVLKALCGVEGEDVMLTAEVVCALCIEEITRLRARWQLDEDDICPLDGESCPDELALFDLVTRRVLPE